MVETAAWLTWVTTIIASLGFIESYWHKQAQQASKPAGEQQASSKPAGEQQASSKPAAGREASDSLLLWWSILA